jgi:superfamily I DNA/RNA helicase
MKENKIELTKEQKNCVEYDLEKKLLVIEANPGTGKTEVLKNRVLYIHQQNKQQRKLILVLSYNRNIVGEIKIKLKAEKLKTYRRFKDFAANINHRHTCSLNECPTYLENTKPLILVCTIHSLANGINSLVLAKQFSEKRKIKVLTTTQRVENKHGFVTGEENKHKFT